MIWYVDYNTEPGIRKTYGCYFFKFFAKRAAKKLKNKGYENVNYYGVRE